MSVSPFPPATNEPASPARILVVDDDKAICMISARILARAGFAVDIARDGEEAWLALGRDTYDLVITDQNMPCLDGLGLIFRLRRASPDTPVILMSGALSDTPSETPPSFRPDAFMPKPFTAPDLVRQALRHVRRRGSQS